MCLLPFSWELAELCYTQLLLYYNTGKEPDAVFIRYRGRGLFLVDFKAKTRAGAVAVVCGWRARVRKR